MTNLSRAEVEGLIQELHEASTAYYQTMQEEGLADADFDAKVAFLTSLAEDPTYADLFQEGTKGFMLLEGNPSLGTEVAATADALVHHETPMLSLGKAKTMESLTSFVTKAEAAGATSFRLQAKLDGFALSARYEGGSLRLLATRGNGTVGENVTYLVNAKEVTVKGLPKTIARQELLEVRGELFFTDDQFRQVDQARVAAGGEPFKNSRNAVVGLMKKAKLGVSYPVEFTFSAYSVSHEDAPAALSLIQDEGFITVDALTASYVPATMKLQDLHGAAEVSAAVEAFGKVRGTLPIPTDGAVVKCTNEAEMFDKMGFTSHHPNSQVAYKYLEATAETVITGFTITVGKTGRVTPTAMLAPVSLEGIILKNASCHNYNWAHERDLRVGSIVTVYRANDVIPQIEAVIMNPPDADAPEVPTICPKCLQPLSYDQEDVYPPKTLTCENMGCPSRDFAGLKNACGKGLLDIDGLAVSGLTALYESGRVTTIADIFTLTEEELANTTMGYTDKGTPRRIGNKRAQHILHHIELAKTAPLWKLLGALNVESLGHSTAKALVRAYGSIDRIMALTPEEIAGIDGLGYITAEKLVKGFAYRRPLLEAMKANGVVFEDRTASGEGAAGDAPLAGLSFAISGEVPAPFSNRGAWVEYLEAQGATFDSSPKATTTYMVGDPSDTSNKVVKAKKLGLSFLSPQEFTARFTS